MFVVLRHFDLNGLRRRVHHVSAQRKFALELRLDLVLLFAITEGFLGTLYFVWLGASLDRALGSYPSMMVLGLGAIAVHGAMRLTGQPVGLGILAAAQLGVPVSAVTLGAQSGVLAPGEGPAIVLGALVTIAAAAVASRFVARRPA
ncbi:hypothetical protein ASG84_08450 [Rhodococcus sp. Leaf278]|nr:hypothetical protein ASG84_08450 [Rhodococcus sp. Leaf278]